MTWAEAYDNGAVLWLGLLLFLAKPTPRPTPRASQSAARTAHTATATRLCDAGSRGLSGVNLLTGRAQSPTRARTHALPAAARGRHAGGCFRRLLAGLECRLGPCHCASEVGTATGRGRGFPHVPTQPEGLLSLCATLVWAVCHVGRSFSALRERLQTAEGSPRHTGVISRLAWLTQAQTRMAIAVQCTRFEDRAQKRLK